jgi:hypothetical protein
MVAVTHLLPSRSWLLPFLCASLMVSVTPVAAAADAAGTSAAVDTLWNQPQGTRPDSALYIVQLWWDGLTRPRAQDQTQRGLQELSQANSDLLNAYSLLQEMRDDPGPHPVAVVDPVLSGAYGFITGVHVKAPIGSVLSWLNQSLVHLEGRGNTDAIVRALLYDYQAQRAAAGDHLAAATTDPVWAANSARQTAMLARIQQLAAPSLGVALLLAEASSTEGKSLKDANGKGNGKDQAHGQAGDPHDKASGHKSAKP